MSAIPSTGNTAKRIKYDPIPTGAFPARLVQFVGLGVQERPAFQGKSKGPAFKAQLAFELVGKKATGVDSDGKPIDPRPSCVFDDIHIFPGMEKGNAFDFCKILDPTITKVPADLEWFRSKIGAELVVTVGSYKAKTGDLKPCVDNYGQLPQIAGLTIPNAESPLVFFDPYSDSEDNKEAYNNLQKFQREALTKAIDKDQIPFAGVERDSISNGKASPTPIIASTGTVSTNGPEF